MNTYNFSKSVSDALNLPFVESVELSDQSLSDCSDTTDHVYGGWLGTGFPGEKNGMYGKDPWNKGLTKETSPILALVGEKVKKSFEHRDVSGSNNHYYGKKHSDEIRQKMCKPKSDTSKMGIHIRSESQKNFNRQQMLELHKHKKTCDKCNRSFDPGNYAKHIRKCS
jgi:hypothetical protein